MLRRLFPGRRAAPAADAALPPGERVYAVGDIHGRADLLDDLLVQIDADDVARGEANTTLVFLGDLVDRGLQSAAVVERLYRLSRERPNARFLLGNHEEIFLLALSGDVQATRLFCRIGGRETVLSYGLAADAYELLGYSEVSERLRALVPTEHRDFVGRFEDMILIGDYAFVHAGIRPGVPLDRQRSEDLRWIREPFLDHRGPLERMIVHGHTIRSEVQMPGHRIGIDTGAYTTGRLTALGLEASERWTLQT